MQPVKNWGIERRELPAARGQARRVWQLTAAAAPAWPLWFNRPSWCPAWPQPLFVAARGGVANLYTFAADWAVLQLTDLAGHPAAPGAAALRLAVYDPTGGGLLLPGGGEPPDLLRYDFDSGRLDCVQRGAGGCLTCDGRYALAVAVTRGPAGAVARSRLRRCDLQSGEQVDVHEEDGEIAGLIGSPADAGLVIWVNALPCAGRKLRLDTGAVGTWVEYRTAAQAHHHFSFVPQSSLILTAYEDGGRTRWQVLDPDGRRMDHLSRWDDRNVGCATASHDRGRVVGAAAGARQVLLFERFRKQSTVLCALGPETVPAEPVFAPDDRAVLCAGAAAGGASQLFLAEL